MNSSSTLREYIDVLRRRKWIALQAVVVIPLAAVGLSMLQAKKYSASAEILLSRQNLANSLNNVVDPSLTVDPQRLIDTQANVARAPQIAAAVVKAARLDRTPGEFLASSSVSAKTGADVLVFRDTDRDAALAAKLATLYAQKYLSYSNQLATRALRKARREVESKMSALELSGDRKSALYADLVSKDQQLATMEALQTGNAVLLRRAEGASQVQPRPVRNGLLGLLVGLVLGVGLAFLRDHLDTRVRTARDVADQLGLPLLARLPEPSRHLRKHNRLVMAEQPTSAEAEPFRVLYTNLEFVTNGRRPRTILVTSAREGEGKSTTAANLALTMARTGRRVALIDLDLRRPFVHEFFQIPRRPGLTNLALGGASLDDALSPIPIDAVEHAGGSSPPGDDHDHPPEPSPLEVMPSGPVPPNAGEFVRSLGVSDVLASLAEIFDTVIIDGGPLLGVGDSLALTARVDALLIVARLDLLRRPMLNELRLVLDGCPANPLGIVVTGADQERGYGYGYGYGYGQGQAESANDRAAPARLRDKTEDTW